MEDLDAKGGKQGIMWTKARNEALKRGCVLGERVWEEKYWPLKQRPVDKEKEFAKRKVIQII